MFRFLSVTYFLNFYTSQGREGFGEVMPVVSLYRHVLGLKGDITGPLRHLTLYQSSGSLQKPGLPGASEWRHCHSRTLDWPGLSFRFHSRALGAPLHAAV